MSFTAVFRREALGLVQLAVPLVAGLIVSSLLLLTDTWLLGPLGETALASASLAASVSLILWSALYGFLAPVGVLVARAWGAGDHRKVAAVVAHGCWLGRSQRGS